MGGIQVFK